jgi:YaiO family outer membrane protein
MSPRERRFTAASWALGLAACAADVHASPLSLEAAHTVEQLSAARANWRSTEFLASWRDPAGWAANGTLRRTERFALIDSQVEAGAAIGLAPQWRSEAELFISESHRVLPVWRWRGRVWRDGIAGWNFALGAGRTLYRGAITQGSAVAELQAERYGPDWRFAWASSATRLDGASISTAHVARADWYVHERLTFGATLGRGREVENTPNTGLVSSSVRSAALKAQWALTPAWWLGAELSSHRQGDLYERNGLRLGLRFQH